MRGTSTVLLGLIAFLSVVSLSGCHESRADDQARTSAPARATRVTPTGAQIERWRNHMKFGDSAKQVEGAIAKAYPGLSTRKYSVGLVVEVPTTICKDLGVYFHFLEGELTSVQYSATRCSYREGLVSRFVGLYGAPVHCSRHGVVGQDERVEERCVWLDAASKMYVEVKTWQRAVDEHGGPLNVYFQPIATAKFDLAEPDPFAVRP